MFSVCLVHSRATGVHWLTCGNFVLSSIASLFLFLIFIYWFRERRGVGREGGEKERETLMCYSIPLCIHWVILVCALTGDWTRNLGLLGQCSNQLSRLARAASLYHTRLQVAVWETRLNLCPWHSLRVCLTQKSTVSLLSFIWALVKCRKLQVTEHSSWRGYQVMRNRST